MKRIVVILLCVVYGFTTIGPAIHVHYCMNESIGWNFGRGKEDKACDKCGMKEDSSGCCKDEHTETKLKTEHQKSAIRQFIHLLYDAVLPKVVDNFQFLSLPDSSSLSLSAAPPEPVARPIFLPDCCYLI